LLTTFYKLSNGEYFLFGETETGLTMS